jgi:hypothetical protein
MDISVEKNKSESNCPGSFFTVLRIVQGLARRMMGIFALTEEEREKAGIFLGGEGRD